MNTIARTRALLGVWLAAVWPAAALGQAGYQAHYLYLGHDHPNEAENYWSQEAQGLAHDDDHWFLTQVTDLWRVPVEDNLAADNPGPNVRHKAIEDTPLSRAGYNHFGDLAHFEHQGRRYLFIPITGPEGGPCPAIAVFDPDTLNYVDHACVRTASWVALDLAGLLYVCEGTALFRYEVRWDLLADRNLQLESETQIPVRDENGRSLNWNAQQGGAFSSDGALLYISTGHPDHPAGPNGIHVFDTTTWRRVRKSSNGSMPFNFAYAPRLESEEPEGLTIWDLDDGRAPGIRGQLHVILLDNDWPSDDDVFVKHYTTKIYVDGGYRGSENGRPDEPFHTVREAYNLAWNGAQIHIRARNYPENFTLSKRVRMTAWGGTARIGD